MYKVIIEYKDVESTQKIRSFIITNVNNSDDAIDAIKRRIDYSDIIHNNFRAIAYEIDDIYEIPFER